MISKAKSARWTPVAAQTVCAQIASAALPDDPIPHVRDEVSTMRVGHARSLCGTESAVYLEADKTSPVDATGLSFGSITLRAHQVDAVRRIHASIRSVGGALLADAVGLGKTYVALALAHDYQRAHVVAPATLLPMWRDAIAATGLVNVTLHSLHALSRRPISVEPHDGSTLVIVDEAHHLRTRNTVRYRNALQFTAGRDVLLMSATPVHNRTRELRNLLALFLGHRVDALDRATLAQCVVRRTSADANSVVVPTIREHAAIVIPDNRAVLECILQLAPPLPVNEGTAASALVRLGLLRAWCSSDAALTDRIRQRQLRGEALLHSLAHGRYPTQRELETWIVGNDSVQLGFPELLIATTSGDTSVLLKTLVSHLDSLQTLLQVHTRTSMADASRSSALRVMLQNEPHPPIIAFSQFASTVRALHRALSDMAGVASLTSEGGRIASGPIARQELIASFAPKANGRPPPGESRKIRLLITTDLLAEGVNLQDAGTVVHLDLPWTHALKQQRVGRVARMGSLFSVIHVHTFAPPIGAESALRLIATLERKAGLHRDWVGNDQHEPDEFSELRASAADESTQLRTLFLRWRSRGASSELLATSVATVLSMHVGWIAAVQIHNEQIVVSRVNSPVTAAEGNAPVQPVAQPCVSTDTSTLLRAARAADDALRPNRTRMNCREIDPDEQSVQFALHELNNWLHTRELQSLAGHTARSVSPAQKRALDALAARLNETAAARRSAIAELAARIEIEILACRGAGAEHALMKWSTRANSLSTAAWLASFPSFHNERMPHAESPQATPSQRVIALLLLQPDVRESSDESLT